MREDTITALPDPNGFSADPLTDLIRSGFIKDRLEAHGVADKLSVPEGDEA